MSWLVVNKVKLLTGDQGYHWEAKLIMHIAFLYCFSETYLHSVWWIIHYNGESTDANYFSLRLDGGEEDRNGNGFLPSQSKNQDIISLKTM